MSTTVRLRTPHADLHGVHPRYGRLGPLISDEMALERQIRAATRENLERHSSVPHKDMQLYDRTEDGCQRRNPDQEDGLPWDDLDDYIAADFDRLNPEHAALLANYRRSYDERRPAYEAKREHRATFLQAQLLDLMQALYDDEHTGDICLHSPQGTCCVVCTDGDEDFGYEPGACSRREDAIESYAEFWWDQGDADNRPTADAA